eukprot:scaffold1954_cov268-Pinguiococcus_pyrenoidosus.AAC.63
MERECARRGGMGAGTSPGRTSSRFQNRIKRVPEYGLSCRHDGAQAYGRAAGPMAVESAPKRAPEARFFFLRVSLRERERSMHVVVCIYR